MRLRPEGLWGGIMSGTVPPARALGPLGAIVFGVPVSLGLDVDAVHIVTSLLIATATAVCFIALVRLDVVFAWLWLLVFSASGVLWWNAAMLWSNTLLLPLGLIVAALAAACLSQPNRATLACLILTSLVALQLHLVAVVAAPIVVIVWAVTRREARPGRRLHPWLFGAAAAAVIAPYMVAEALTGFANTRAIVGYLGSSSAGATIGETGSAMTSLVIALDPTRVLDGLGLGVLPVIVVGSALSLAAVIWVRRGPLFWLTVSAVAGIAGQALFFLWMSRPFAGYHHVTLLSPFYAVVPAVLLRRGLFRPVVRMHIVCVTGGVVLAVLVIAGPSLADRFAERTPWSYTRIRASLDALCGGVAVDTDEGQAFAAQLNPQYDGVLRFMMKRGMTTCRYQPSSDVLIAAARDGQYPASKTIGQSTFYRELVLPPGIARYRRAP
jgi:hypothetical protein